MANTCTTCKYEALPVGCEPCLHCGNFSRWEPKTEAEPVALTRESVLNSAKEIVLGDRDEEYGGPEDSFARIAKIWTGYKGVDFTPVDVALMLAGLKMARLAENPKHRDSWIDLAGYAACGGECSGRE